MVGAMMPNPYVDVGSLEDLTSTITRVTGSSSNLQNRMDAVRAMFVSPDGKKMIIGGRNDAAHSNGISGVADNKTLYAQMTMSTPFDLTTLAVDTSVGGIDVSGGTIESGFWNPRDSTNRPEGMWINTDGTKGLFGMSNNLLHMYDITNFNLPTTNISPTSTFTDSSSVHQGYAMKPDGTKLYIYSHEDIISQFDLSTPFDLSTVTNRQSIFLGSGTETSPHGLGTLTGKDVLDDSSPQGADIFVSQYDGKTVWIALRQNSGLPNDPITNEVASDLDHGTIIECSLSTAYDITTLSAVSSSASNVKTMYTLTKGRTHQLWVNEQRKAKTINMSVSGLAQREKRSWV